MRPQSRKLFVVWVVFALLAAACVAPAPPTPTPTPGPLDLVQAFQETYNRRDTDSFLALFADDAGWTMWTSALGVKAVRNVAEYGFELNTRMELIDCTTEAGAVVCQLAVTNECTPPDIAPERYNAKFVFKESRISVIWTELIDPGWDAAYGEYDSARWDWAVEVMPAVTTVLDDENEWRKFSNGDMAGNFSAIELGQLVHQYCTGYTEAGY